MIDLAPLRAAPAQPSRKQTRLRAGALFVSLSVAVMRRFPDDR